MEAKDYRIGNYYQWDGEGKFLKIGIEQLSKLSIGTTRIKPIPLTEQVLVDCFGFIQCKGKYGEYLKCSKLDGFRMWHVEKEDDSWWCIGRKDYDTDETIFIYGNCRTVHQLQNLYFALTGQELEYKPKK